MKLPNRFHCAVLLLAGAFNQGIVPPAKVTGVIEVDTHQDWYFEAVADSSCTLKLKGLGPGVSARLEVFDLQAGVLLGVAEWINGSSSSAVSTGTLLLETSGRFGVRVTGLGGVGSYAVSHRLSRPKPKPAGSLVPIVGTTTLQLDFDALAEWRLDLRSKFQSGPAGLSGLTLLHPSGLEEDLLRACKLKLSDSKADLLRLDGHPLPESGRYSLLVHRDTPASSSAEIELLHRLRAPKPTKSVVEAGSYQTVLYVDDNAGVGGNGADWPHAFRDLQTALARARQLLANPLLDLAPLGPTSIELRVAGGTYRPDSGTLDRTLAFEVPEGLAVRGGYAGLAGSGGDERDITAFPTVLSGDLLGNDAAGFQFRQDNSASVVVSGAVAFLPVSLVPPSPPVEVVPPPGSSVILDGVTVRGAHWTPLDEQPRGALFVDQARVVIRDCDIRDNSGSTIDSYIIPGVARLRGVLVLVDTRFRDNRIDLKSDAAHSAAGVLLGGAARIDTADALVSILKRCEFTGNSVQMDSGIEAATGLPGFKVYGSALHATGTLQIVESTIAENLLSVIATTPHPMDSIEVRGVGAFVSGNIALVDCDIRGNRLDVTVGVPSVSGAGIGLGGYLYSSGFEGGGRIQGCRITGNRHQATQPPLGPSLSGGGLSGYFPHLADTLVAGNVAPTFGGVECLLADSEILGCTIAGNTSTVGPATSFIAGGRVVNSLLAGNLSLLPPGPAVELVMGLGGPVVFDHSLVGANLSALVVAPLGVDGLAGTGDESWEPLPGSALIDGGWDESYAGFLNPLGIPAVAGKPLRDAAGAPRFQVVGQPYWGTMSDVGAFEAQP